MAAFIAIDGHSLNFGLQKIIKNNSNNSRIRIDYEQLALFLKEGISEREQVELRFYTDASKLEKPTFQVMGRITKYFPKGFGFIAATDGNNYFFHNNEIVNKRALCNADEARYPNPTGQEFKNRILNKIVSFKTIAGEDGRLQAEEVRLEFGSKALDSFYQQRREPFLEMLGDSGYKIIRCRSSNSGGKSKSVDCRIYLDALTELEEDEQFILVSDDPIFGDLLIKLMSYGINTTIVTFDTERSKELRGQLKIDGTCDIVLLDDYLDDLELKFDESDEDDRLSLDDANSQATEELPEVLC